MNRWTVSAICMTCNARLSVSGVVSGDDPVTRVEALARELGWLGLPPRDEDERCARRPGHVDVCAACVAEIGGIASLREREACAAYALDRADQYETSSGTCVGIADVAQGIARGEAAETLARGETEDLLARVRTMAKGGA